MLVWAYFFGLGFTIDEGFVAREAETIFLPFFSLFRCSITYFCFFSYRTSKPHLRDLASGLGYLLHHEVPMQNTIAGERLDALKEFMAVLAQVRQLKRLF